MESQRKVIAALVDVVRSIDTFCGGGHQLFLFGRIGTGKDHLSIAVAKQAAMAGYSARWVDAANLYDEWIDYRTRKKAIQRYKEPDILLLSDAVCTRDWTEKRQAALRRVANDRWFAGKSTWTTANVTAIEGDGPNTAESAFVKDTLDRLTDSAIVLHCDWQSYRKTRRWNSQKNGGK